MSTKSPNLHEMNVVKKFLLSLVKHDSIDQNETSCIFIVSYNCIDR